MTVALLPHVSATETDSGMVLLDERAGRYWQLNPTAATVIRCLLDGEGPDAAVDRLTAAHPAGAERVAVDVAAFVKALDEAKLVRR